MATLPQELRRFEPDVVRKWNGQFCTLNEAYYNTVVNCVHLSQDFGAKDISPPCAQMNRVGKFLTVGIMGGRWTVGLLSLCVFQLPAVPPLCLVITRRLELWQFKLSDMSQDSRFEGSKLKSNCWDRTVPFTVKFTDVQWPGLPCATTLVPCQFFHRPDAVKYANQSITASVIQPLMESDL